MALYFYSTHKVSKAIRAATGVKGILFPESEVVAAFQEFWDAVDCGGELSPTQAYAKAVKKLGENADFAEELDHYAIVEKSAAARALFTWNVVCRMAFSVQLRHPEQLFGDRARPIHLEVVRYSQAYMTFFLAASPLLEESYNRRCQQDAFAYTHLYAPNMMAASAYLDEYDELPDHASLAASVDDAFMQMWKGRNKLGTGVFYRNVPPGRLVAHALTLGIFRPPLTSVGAILLVLRRLLELSWRMGRPLLTLLRTGRNNQSVVGLVSATPPALLSPRGLIDPIGFVANRAHWDTMEHPCDDKLAVYRGRLLWHVLTRCAEVAGMLRANISVEDIEAQFQALWDFYARGFVPNAEVRDAATAIELGIIDRMRAERRKDPMMLSDPAFLAAIGLELFHHAVGKEMSRFERQGRIDDFAKAFGITYMQV